MRRRLDIIVVCRAFHTAHPKCERGDTDREKVLMQYKRVIFAASLGHCIVCGRTVTRRCTRCRQHDTFHRYHSKKELV